MARIIIKVEKDDIKVSELGECFFVECNNNIALIITQEALKELVDDYNTIVSERNTPGGERGRGSCPECGEGYDNEEEWLYNTECESCGHPIPEHLIIKKP
jgi:hypothetical protein